MKKALSLLFFAFSGTILTAQLNMELLSRVQYPTDINDVWGWVHPETGTEYALVGVRNGFSIVSLEDPANAQQVAFIPGASTTWRDIKTWGNFAYVTNEGANGLLVVDLYHLPDSVTHYNWAPELPGLGILSTCHNLYIDESGYCYLAGCNLNDGGMIILDVDTPTGEPEFVAAAPPVYAHDVYTASNLMYASEIYVGAMSVYDVSDKNNIQLLASQPTPFRFTHNVWLNEAETVAFTTDERPNAPIGAYDVSDLTNIVELDQYRPVGSLGQGVIPHNVHVWDDYLLISYYTDGGRVVDASRPTNLIEVGNFDTWLGNPGGFNGAWGLYPFLPSQTVLVADITNGLFVLRPTFMRACWLEGVVTDSITGANINNVRVIIDSDQPNLGTTNAFGRFNTGQVLSGGFEVTFSKPGYRQKTISVALENGVLTEVAVELVPLASYAISGRTLRDADGLPVAGAQVIAQNEEFTYQAQTDANGNFLFLSVTEGTYNLYAGQWGYLHAVVENVNLNGNTNLSITLQEGYQDDFLFDLGWTATHLNATSGFWERGEPIGTFFNGQACNPGADAPNDLGRECYITGNGGGGAGDDDVDEGIVTLTSPAMDLSNYQDPVLTGLFWFFNAGGATTPNDDFSIRLSNGSDEVEIFYTAQSQSQWRPLGEIHLAQHLELTGNMRLIVETSDLAPTGHLVEAAIDQILIEERSVTSTAAAAAAILIQAFPNPFRENIAISYQLEPSGSAKALLLYNSLGQEIKRFELRDHQGQISFGHELPKGVYWAKLTADGQLLQSLRVVKQ